MGRGWRVGSVPKHDAKRATLAVVSLTLCWALSSPAVAMHETDHRFTVEGFVCGPDGQPIQDEKVVVKDTRVSVATPAYTDSDGYYKAVLHLHDDNVGDPLLVSVLDQEQRATAEFDPKDRRTERSLTVNFGAGCETAGLGPPRWLYYGAGITAAGIAVYAGARVIRKRRRSARGRGKGPGKHRKT